MSGIFNYNQLKTNVTLLSLKIPRILALIAGLIWLPFSSPAHALDEQKIQLNSLIFSDVIKSNGVGNINLLKSKSAVDFTLSGYALEAFRVDHQGALVFAVDVNESSNGLENRDSQGVAIKSASITFTTAEQSFTISTFDTVSQSILKSADTATNQLFYTLLGEAGANLVTPNADSNINNTSMDSLLTFYIDRDLSNVTSAVLNIELLTVDPSKIGPEQFYDFSNGFERVALVTQQEAKFISQLERGVALAPLVIKKEVVEAPTWHFYPSSSTFYLASYEDLYPNKGDYDFNDLVVAYQLKASKDANNEITSISGSGYLVARGAEFDHDFYLAIDLPESASGTAQVSFNFDSYAANNQVNSTVFSGAVNLLLVESVKSHFQDGDSTYVNTHNEQAIIQGPRFDFTLTFDTPFTHDLSQLAPFDPYIYVHESGYEIHSVNHQPRLPFSNNGKNKQFRDNNGFPFALIFNSQWQPPLAGIDMGEAYPTFIDHVKSNGESNKQWFNERQNSKIKSIPHWNWRW